MMGGRLRLRGSCDHAGKLLFINFINKILRISMKLKVKVMKRKSGIGTQYT